MAEDEENIWKECFKETLGSGDSTFEEEQRLRTISQLVYSLIGEYHSLITRNADKSDLTAFKQKELVLKNLARYMDPRSTQMDRYQVSEFVLTDAFPDAFVLGTEGKAKKEGIANALQAICPDVDGFVLPQYGTAIAKRAASISDRRGVLLEEIEFPTMLHPTITVVYGYECTPVPLGNHYVKPHPAELPSRISILINPINLQKRRK